MSIDAADIVLHAFWNAINQAALSDDVDSLEQREGPMRAQVTNAGLVMQGMIDTAGMDLSARQQFAQAAIFETTLNNERGGVWDTLSHVAGSSNGYPPLPHVVMLQGIYDIARGADFFAVPDPSGIASWIAEPVQAALVVNNVLNSDPSPAAVAATLGILADAAIPTTWPDIVINGTGGLQGLGTLESRNATTRWAENANDDQNARKTILALLARVRARLLASRASLFQGGLTPSGGTSQLPGVINWMIGNTPIAMLPAASKPLYKNGRLISTGVLGLFGGLLFASSRKRQARR
jgi:hypothetical protein